jgi:hypothetical protein
MDVGKKKCFRALAKTIQDFSGIHQVRFVVNPQKRVFNGYLEVPSSMILYKESDVDVIRERDEQVAKLLKNPRLASLVRAYLAYLITKDIRRLSLVDGKEIPETLSQLDSEKEFAFFRPELANQGSLFLDGRFKDYVPKYATLEHFFTGLFVKNLLWIESAKEKEKPLSGNNDYKVHFLNEQECSKCR